MGSPSFSGTTYVELARGWVRDPRNGVQLIRSYHGQYDALALLESSAAANGRKTTMEPLADGTYTLRVQYGADDSQSPDQPLATVWELVGNDMEKSLWTLPEVKEVTDKITTVHGKAVIKKLVESWARGDTEAELDNGDTLTLNESNIKAMLNLYDVKVSTDQDTIVSLGNALSRGEESWLISQFVIRRTVTIASNSGESLKPAYDNVNKMLTKDAFNRIEQPPSTIKFNLPDGYFLKRTPTVRQVTADKWEVQSEWWHADDYDELIYEEVA